MFKLIAWLLLALLAVGVVALNIWDRAEARKREARGEPEPDDETWIW